MSKIDQGKKILRDYSVKQKGYWWLPDTEWDDALQELEKLFEAQPKL